MGSNVDRRNGSVDRTVADGDRDNTVAIIDPTTGQTIGVFCIVALYCGLFCSVFIEHHLFSSIPENFLHTPTHTEFQTNF